MPVRFETRCIRLTMLGRGKIKVTSDGFIQEGIWDCEQLNHKLSSLTKDGWILMSSVDRTSPSAHREAMDLFFRKEIAGVHSKPNFQSDILCADLDQVA